MDKTQQKKKLGKDKYREERYVWYPFRSLENYKAMHKERAKKMGVLEEFLAAQTLTSARKIVFP